MVFMPWSYLLVSKWSFTIREYERWSKLRLTVDYFYKIGNFLISLQGSNSRRAIAEVRALARSLPASYPGIMSHFSGKMCFFLKQKQNKRKKSCSKKKIRWLVPPIVSSLPTNTVTESFIFWNSSACNYVANLPMNTFALSSPCVFLYPWLGK